MPVNIVWLKRDLRLHDHEPLASALASDYPTLLLYVFEPEAEHDPHLSLRHFRFIHESLQDLMQQCSKLALLVKRGPIIDVLDELSSTLGIQQLYSHQEVGLDYTFRRDLEVKHWCDQQGIVWAQSPTGAVIRGLTSRARWDTRWRKVMRAEIANPDLDNANWLSEVPASDPLPKTWQQPDAEFQLGGERAAWETLNSFYEGRGQDYYRQLSSPNTAMKACTRLSPYLAWGNISLRQVYQTLLASWKRPGWRRTLRALSSRLHWHCHFIQKFESESRMEFEHLNRGYNGMPLTDDDTAKRYLQAWKTGNTGVPMIDACMRCLHHTGYINFRMRAMLVSFLTHHLAVDWRLGAPHLASLFLDFEPGIHYAQFQMQAGVTGVNTIRIYNPVKQGEEQDPEGQFVRRWCPELAAVPNELIHKPWQLTVMEQQLYQVEFDRDYPAPIVDLTVAAKQARDRLWSWRNKPEVKREKQRILNRHVAQKAKPAQ